MTKAAEQGRWWLRGAAAILVFEGVAWFIYAPLIPAPILPDVGVRIPTLGLIPLAWGVLGVAQLAGAAGVIWRRGWGRALGAVIAAGSLAFTIAGLVQVLARADLAALESLPGGLLTAGLDLVVLFAVLRRWPQPRAVSWRDRPG